MVQGLNKSAGGNIHPATVIPQILMTTKSPKRRSQSWFGRQDRNDCVHWRGAEKPGCLHHSFDRRPVANICNAWPELITCNSHFRELAGVVKRGVLKAGRMPLEFSVVPLGLPDRFSCARSGAEMLNESC